MDAPVAKLVEAFADQARTTSALADATPSKEIRALRIERIDGRVLHFAPGWTSITIDKKAFARGRTVGAGDYYVLHDDGHVAIIAAKVFETCRWHLRGL